MSEAGQAQRIEALKRASNVLVIKFGTRASFVQAMAAMAAIREFHVGARITLLTVDAHKQLAENCPYFDRVDPEGKPREPQATAALIGRIRAAKYDMVYDLEHTARTANYFLALRPWPPNWSGKAPGASHFWEEPNGAEMHPIDRWHAQLRAAGYDLPETPDLPDLSWVRQAFRDPPRLQPAYFSLRGPYVLFAPLGGADAQERGWGAARYGELARRVAARGVTPVIVGEADSREIAAAIAKVEPRAKNIAGRADIFQTATLAERAAYVVGEDSGAMHVAAAAAASCLVLAKAGPDLARRQVRSAGGVVVITATVLADLPADQVDRALRNCGAYPAATA